ncbi:hypothetical protein [Roseobacter sp. GAI101]|uniref:hypothetical protein n=1 Tax=Roseobacter sp. (strain GAI101) TaxID=391589 RepID=UPI0018DEA7C8|nr:hypothetical protein [Roseobacter sp. GAI101]
MKLGIALSTLALVALPSLGMATCSSQKHAMSCADGMVYDAESASCVTSATS